MKVQTKLAYSHAVIVVLLIIGSVTSVFILRSSRDLIHDIVSDRYLKTIYLDNVMYAVKGIDVSMYKLLLAADNSTGELDNIDKYKMTMTENVSKLEPLIRSGKGKILLKTIQNIQGDYLSFVREQSRAVLLVNSEESKVSLFDKQLKHSAVLLQAIDNLTDYQTYKMREGESLSNREYQMFLGIVLSACLLSVIISFLIAVKAIRSLVNQLGAEPGDIIEILENISQGNLQDEYGLRRNQNKTGIIKYVDILLEELRERDGLVQSELALGTQLEETVYELRRRDVLQETIRSVLEISLEHVPLQSKLQRIMDIIVSIPGISIEQKGCIHLKVDGAEELQMVAQRNLHEHLLTACARLQYGQCLCGIAASTGKTVFSNKLDDLHTVSFEGMHEHGHYCIPIKSGSNVLGVLCLYVRHNHERSKLEESSFVSITNSIATIIEHGKGEDSIKRINKFTQTVLNSINDSLTVIDVNDFTIVSTNNNFLREYKLAGTDVIGRHCYEVTHKVSEPCNQQEYSCPVMTMLRTGEYAMSEHLHYDEAGKEVYVSCSASPIKDDAGNIIQCVYVLRNISQRKYYEKQLQQLAHYDVVTSLPNRILLLDRLNIAIEFSTREGNMMALLFIDLDKFKAVNDTYGHETGDILLREVSTRLLSNVRKSDTVSRVGGDEFIIILTKVSGKLDAGLIADKIIESLNKTFFINGHECRIGGSIGIELYPFSDFDYEIENITDVLIKRADVAMYKAKELGRNRFEYYSSDLSAESETPVLD
ncbi:diguanylate cyclase domain-containing protein [Candidatus Magnetominusculus dajiuhuensis]|uniref:diguanylate cyclase domain-containing protein n=1 Tax=Candidatus Magnetominusculus dajiuhuensis TaxID=3137712 RepID=UPI003B42FE68